MSITPTDTTIARAHEAAQRFLRRWHDGATLDSSDDVVQEATIAAWRGQRSVRQPERWEAFVRTISRRRRWHTLEDRIRRRTESLEAHPRLRWTLAGEERRPRTLVIAGWAVPITWCLAELDDVLRGLDPLNAHLLHSFYEGFSCGELAERYDIPEQCVKVRLYRSRKRVRHDLERRVIKTVSGAYGPCPF